MDKEENRSRKVTFVVCTVNSLSLFHIQSLIEASRSEPHTNPPYEKIAVPMYVCLSMFVQEPRKSTSAMHQGKTWTTASHNGRETLHKQLHDLTSMMYWIFMIFIAHDCTTCIGLCACDDSSCTLQLWQYDTQRFLFHSHYSHLYQFKLLKSDCSGLKLVDCHWSWLYWTGCAESILHPLMLWHCTFHSQFSCWNHPLAYIWII